VRYRRFAATLSLSTKGPKPIMTLVVILTVQRQALSAFREFELAAARVMKRHGGAIERAVVIPGEPTSELFREVHVLKFPSPEALAAYQNDTELLDHSVLRAQAIVHTDVMIGDDGPDYMSLIS
jgi:hypothetical protein